MKKVIIFWVFILSFSAVISAGVRAPENLNVIYIDNNTLKIIWDASGDTFPVSYSLFRAGTSDVSPTNHDLDVAMGTITVYTDSAVNIVSAVHYYMVRAYTSFEGLTCTARKSLPMPAGIFGTVGAAPQNSKALLTWAPTTDPALTGYSIYRATSAGGNFTKLSSIPAAQLQYLDTGIVNGLQYYYKIAGSDGSDGALLPGPGAVMPFAAPFAPVNLSGTVSGADIVLNWSNQGIRGTYDIAYFNVYNNPANTVPDTVISNTNTVTYTHAGPGPVAGARNNYKVTVEDVRGNTSMPAFTSVYFRDSNILGPENFTITAATSNSVSLEWSSLNDPGQIDGYRIYRNDVTLTAEPANTITAAAAYVFTDTSALTLNSLYWYSVEAYRDSAPAAAPIAAGPVYVTVLPAAPLNLTISQTGAGRLHLLWARNPNENASTSIYNVYRSTTAGDFSDPSQPVSQTAQALVQDDLNAGIIYYYRVATLLDGIQSMYAETHATAVTPPVSPADITFIDGTPFNSYVHLSWTAAADFDAHTFNVYYKFSTVAASVYALDGSTGSTEKYVTGLKNGMDYNFKVISTNVLGTSAITGARYCTITPQAVKSLDKPLDFRVDSLANSRLSLSWSPVIGAAKYSVFRSLSAVVPEDADSWANSPNTNFYVDIRAFADNAYYYYKVIAVDSLGNTGVDYSDTYGNSAITRAGPPENVELNNTAGGVMLSWTKPADDYTFNADQLKYRIYRSTYPGVFGSPLAETLLTYYGDMSANTLAATLYYKVKSVDGADYEDFGVSAYSIDMSQPISPPAVLIARPGNKRVTLTWKKVTPEYYNIYRSTDAFNFEVPIAHNLDFFGREYIDADIQLQNKIQYFYTIAAVTRGGEGPRAVPASAIPYAPPVLPDARVTCTAKTGKDIFINWTQAEPAALGLGYDITGYNIYRSRDNGWTYSFLTFTPYLDAGGLPDYVTYYTDTATNWDNKYTYLIRVVDWQGNTDAVYDLADVNLALPRNRLKLYANLTDLSRGQSLTWQYVLTNNGRIKVNVYTLSGVFVKNLDDEVYSGTASTLNPFDGPKKTWDGTNAKGRKVASGVYLFVFELNGEKTIEKIAVIR